MATVAIISEQTVLSSFPGRVGKQDLWVQYRLGDDAGKIDQTRTFQVFVPYEEAYDTVAKKVKEDAVREAIRQAEAMRNPATPRVIHI